MISKLFSAAVVVSLLLGGLNAKAQTIEDGVYLYGIDGKTGSLVRHSFDANSEKVVDIVHDLDGKKYTEIDGASHIPGHTNIMGFWYDNAKHTSRLIYINIHTAEAALVGKDLGNVKIMGAATQTIGGVSRIYTVQTGPTGTQLVYVNHQTGDTAVVMSLTKDYDGLAALPDGTFYGTDDDNLYLLDPTTGEEKLLRALKHKHNDSLELMDGKLVGFSTSAGRLWRVDTDSAEMSIHPVDTSVRDIRSIMIINYAQIPLTPGFD